MCLCECIFTTRVKIIFATNEFRENRHHRTEIEIKINNKLKIVDFNFSTL